MSNQEFENYVALIGKLLQLTREQRDHLSGELQDHLEMRVTDLTDEGMPKQKAIAQALEEFGDAAVMARNFQTVLTLNKRRWMMRFATFSIAGTFLAAILTMAMWPGDARFGAPTASVAQEESLAEETAGATDSSDSGTNKSDPILDRLSDATRRNLRTEAKLKEECELSYDETSMSEIMEDLSNRLGVNLILDRSAILDELPEDEPVTIQLAGVPYNKALTMMLKKHNATYFIDDGIVVIISIEVADDSNFLRMRMYDCRELLTRLPVSAPFAMNEPGGSEGSGDGGKRGGGLFCVTQDVLHEDTIIYAGSNQNEPKPVADVGPHVSSTAAQSAIFASPDATLLNLVRTMVDPDSWSSNGTGLASVEVVNGILIVRQKESAFLKIETLLQDLEGYLVAPKR